MSEFAEPDDNIRKFMKFHNPELDKTHLIGAMIYQMASVDYLISNMDAAVANFLFDLRYGIIKQSKPLTKNKKLAKKLYGKDRIKVFKPRS